jgi:hypothetical protein
MEKEDPKLGRKFDGQKPRMSLVPLKELWQVIDVLEYGAKKYAPDNWKYVPNSKQRYFDAAMRHITARQMGEVNDSETGLPHLAHCICCLLFWAWHDNNSNDNVKSELSGNTTTLDMVP